MAINTLQAVVVLDCPEPGKLADFYARMLGGKVEGEGRWVEVRFDSGRLAGRTLAFQEAPDHVPPTWPSGERSQQFHLDFYVPREEWDAAEREVLDLGAKRVQGDDGERDFRVYLDPAGHPFCLCVN
ncbi:MAG TPA: VOC family protein [Streptomyces sp.]|uniref:VOC family protein n=1 Tax=Streptomyces sp. TaxID=1931 RepID=UPI002D28653F|nr:VOC family protein [Streptomyces sp.]HZG06365.1 VOC family protein [Streptomyces sp.]